MLKVKVEGTDKLVKRLMGMSNKAYEFAKDELHAAGLNVESGAKKKITADEHVDTGRLRASIHMESKTVNQSFSYTDDQGNSFDGSLDVDPIDLEVYAGTNVEYAESVRRLDDYLFPPAELERVRLIRRLKRKLKQL